MNQQVYFDPRSLVQLITGLLLVFLGMGIFLIGASPSAFGVDRSPMLGTVQIAFIAIGLGLFSLGSCMSLFWLWKGKQLSISADFGWRLVATGYVVALWTSMADVWGFGTSEVTKILCFGPWQERGVIFGEIMIGIGLLLMLPWKKPINLNNKVIENPPLEEGIENE